MEYYDSNDKTAKRSGAIAVSLYVALILSLMLFVKFDLSYQEPLEGFLVDFGDSEMGLGEEDLALADDMPLPQSTNAAKAEELLTDNRDDAPEIKQTEEDPSKRVDSVVVAKTQATTPEITPEPREVNQKALFPGNTVDSKSTSSGTNSEGGNQGALSGRESEDYASGGSSSGGIEFSLGDRRPRAEFPRPSYSKDEQGKVVVEITVNGVGDVVSATFKPVGSTTTNPTLIAAARQAALGAKFTPSQESEMQTGTMTYIFKLD